MPQENYIFTSQRLGYRPIRETDFDNYFSLDSNPDVREFFPNGVLTAERVKSNMKKNMEYFHTHGFGVFIAIELSTGEFVGRCGFGELPPDGLEVGYVFLPKFWGKGLASEALVSLLSWAQQHIKMTDTIIALTPIEHIASQKVMQKAGMEFYKNEINEGQECVFYKIKLR